MFRDLLGIRRTPAWSAALAGLAGMVGVAVLVYGMPVGPLAAAIGFGAPVPVAAAMLTGLGFSPFYAAGICLLANTAPVAFGSIGTPILVLSGLNGLLSSLAAMLSLLVLLVFWKPTDSFQLVEAGAEPTARPSHSPAQLLSAWTPYALLVVLVLLWGIPPARRADCSVSRCGTACCWVASSDLLLFFTPTLPRHGLPDATSNRLSGCNNPMVVI